MDINVEDNTLLHTYISTPASSQYPSFEGYKGIKSGSETVCRRTSS